MKAKITDENKAIKIGYKRVKQKIKGVRQDYRKAVSYCQLGFAERLMRLLTGYNRYIKFL